MKTPNTQNSIGLAAILTTLIVGVIDYAVPDFIEQAGPEYVAAITGAISYGIAYLKRSKQA